MKKSFPQRKVVYAVGELDNDPSHESLDNEVAASLQDTSRLSRGIHSMGHLQHRYGAEIDRTQPLVIIPGVAHRSGGCFTSPIGQHLLFGVSDPR